MSLTLAQVLKTFEKQVPLSLQEEWDRGGVQVGSRKQKVGKVLFAYDACHEVLRFAIKHKVDLIITHHPMSMQAYDAIDLDSYEGTMIAMAIQNNIAIYSAHTSHDNSKHSLNRFYAQKLKLSKIGPIRPIGPIKGLGAGIYGRLPKPQTVTKLLPQIKKLFAVNKLHFAGKRDQKVKTIGLCTGSGTSLLPDVIAQNIDLFITGDVKYHYAVEAKRHDICLVDVSHFHSEIQSVTLLKDLFKKMFGTRLKLLEYTGLKNALELC